MRVTRLVGLLYFVPRVELLHRRELAGAFLHLHVPGDRYFIGRPVLSFIVENSVYFPFTFTLGYCRGKWFLVVVIFHSGVLAFLLGGNMLLKVLRSTEVGGVSAFLATTYKLELPIQP